MQLKGIGIAPITGAVLLVLAASCASPSSRPGNGQLSVSSTAATTLPAASDPAPTKTSPPQTLSSIPGVNPNVDPTFDAAIAKMNAYVDAAIAKGVDPAKLPRVEIAASLVSQPPTIAAAGKDAVAIAYGTVTSLHFTNKSTVAQVTINSVYKGQLAPRSTIGVELGCVLQPNQTYDGLVFACLPTSPVLLPGQSALLLLHPEKISATWGAELGTQAFPVSNGQMRPSDTTESLEQQVQGLSIAQMVAKLMA